MKDADPTTAMLAPALRGTTARVFLRRTRDSSAAWALSRWLW